jgi:hypothetical protein
MTQCLISSGIGGQEQTLKEAKPLLGGRVWEAKHWDKSGVGQSPPDLSAKNQENRYIPEKKSGINPDDAGAEDKYQPRRPPGYVP